MKGILIVSVVAGAMLVAGASLRPAESAVDGRRDAVVTSFGPIESHDGWMRGEVVEHAPLYSRSASRWVVRLETKGNRRLTRAHVRVVSFMPEDASVPQRPAFVRYVGKGRYEISGLQFDRTGWWNVALAVDYRGRTDSLAFNLLIPERIK